MLSKNQLKLLTSLSQKKYRLEHQLFLAEGIKLNLEFLDSKLELEALFCTDDPSGVFTQYKPQMISEKELKKISNLSNPTQVIGLYKIPKPKPIVQKGLILGLDQINDPGNLGTIIRCCDWFGVEQLICSEETVDCFNPKVVQASMGSLARISIHYLDLENFVKNTSLKVYTAGMKGQNIYKAKLVQNAFLIMGNEARGLSSMVKTFSNEEITIPRFGKLLKTESLNVAVSTAILLNEFRRA